MLQDKSRRGRPKGSGIDDRTRLEAIAELLAADPSLKPTTAIKSIGITDPSAIRRLRDKFHEFSSVQAHEMTSGPDAAIARHIEDPELPDDRPLRSRSLSASGPAAARKVEPPRLVAVAEPAPQPVPVPAAKAEAKPEPTPAPEKPAAASAAPQAAPATHSPVLPSDPAALLITCAGLGIRFASAAIQAQFTLGAQLMRAPPLALAVHAQIVLNEMLMSMFLPPGVRPIRPR